MTTNSSLCITLALAAVALAACESTQVKSTKNIEPAPPAVMAVAPPVAPVEVPAVAPSPSRLPEVTTAPPHIQLPNSTPELIEALRQLTEDDFKVRQEAVNRLQKIMARQFQQTALVQNLMLQIQQGLAEQMRIMTQTNDPESQARVAGLFEFNSALSRWAVDVIALPKEQSERLMAWGLKDENLPIIARAYHRKDEVRIACLKDLVKNNAPEIDWLLIQMLNTPSREVSLMTMDALFDRPANPTITKILWERATIGMKQYDNRYNQNRNRTLTIRGRVVNFYDDYGSSNRAQEAEVAVDVMIKQKDPTTTELLNTLFAELAASINNPNDYRWRALSPNYSGDSGRCLSRLINDFKPREALPFMIKALGNNNQNDGSETTMNNERMRYSTRIDFCAMFCLTAGLDPEDYGMKKYANWGDRWLFKGGVPEEEALAKKLQSWWKETKGDTSKPPSTTTMPASKAEAGPMDALKHEEAALVKKKAAEEAARQAALAKDKALEEARKAAEAEKAREAAKKAN